MSWWNVTTVQSDFFNMFLQLFGSSELVFLFVLGFFAMLCVAGRFRVEESSIVMLPLVWGIVEDGWLPAWIKALFVVAIAVIWFMALIRIIREG